MFLLASKSPRRKQLLEGLDLPYRCVTIQCEESYPLTLQGADIPIYLSQLKADAYHQLDADDVLITADTIVWDGTTMYGKPKDDADAHRMLRALSGKWHEVITGVCITTATQRRTFAVTTRVLFAELTDSEIDYYITHYRPYDKAGAYGVQEWIGYIGVERIEGSYYNVMGLPVQRLYKELKQLNLV